MEAKHVFLAIFYFFILFHFSENSLTQKVKLQQGTLRGLKNLSHYYEAYLGIPYASVGERYKVSFSTYIFIY